MKHTYSDIESTIATFGKASKLALRSLIAIVDIESTIATFGKASKLVVFLSFIFSASAQSIPLKIQSETHLDVQQSTFNQVNFKNTLSAIDKIYTVSIDDKTFLGFQIPNYIHTKSIGAPALPIKTEIIEIPYGSQIHIKITEKEYQEIALKDLGYTDFILPTQAPVSKSAKTPPVLQYQEKIYKRNRYTDNPLVSVEYLGEMRGTQYARVTIAPVQYNPVKNTLRVYHTLNFTLLFENGDEQKTMERKRMYTSPEFKGLESRAVNNLSAVSKFNFSTKSERKGSESYMYAPANTLKYVIVSDTLFAQSLQPFIAWKKQQGFDVDVAYTSNPQVGKTTQSIKGYLQNLYDHPKTYQAPPTYILLVGDVEQIPAFNSLLPPPTVAENYTKDHVTDLYYAEYTGDFLPDVHYGRLSASTVAQLLPQIEKTLKMEQLNLPSTQFMDTSIFIAGYDKGWGFRLLNKQVNYALRNYFNRDHGIYTKAYLFPTSSSQAEEIITNINQGVCVVSYTAHGDWDRWTEPLISLTEINTKFNNQDKYPLMIGNCCLSSKFDKPECFGEALLRADKKGAVAYIGASNSSYFYEDFFWAVGTGIDRPDTVENVTYENTGLGVYDKLFHTHGEDRSQWIVTASDMVTQGNLTVMESSTLLDHYYWEIYHVFGDPSFRIQVKNPDSLPCKHPQSISPAITEIQLQTDPYSGISIHQENQLLAYSVADSNGKALLSFQLKSMNPLTLRVWAQFKRDYVRNIPIDIPQDGYVYIKDREVKNQANTEQSTLIYNDTYTVDVILSNIGKSLANGAKVELISVDDHVIVLTPQSDEIASINASADYPLKDKLKFKVQPNVTDSTAVKLKLRVSSQGQTPFEQSISLLASAPLLETIQIKIDDSQGHTKNGKLDANENVTVYLTFRNAGSVVLRDATVQVSSPQSYIISDQQTIPIGNLESGESKTISFPLGATDQAIQYDLYTLNLTAKSLERTEVFSCQESISLVMEDFENGNFARMDWDTSASTWLISKESPFEGMYCAMSSVVGRNDSTHLIISTETLLDDSIHFHYKVSSEFREGIYGDFLQFYINDELMGAYAGVVPWTKVSFPVKKGTNTFRWTYVKDDSDEAYLDRAWIDNIIFPLGTPHVAANEKEILTQQDENKWLAFVNQSGQIELDFRLPLPLTGTIYLTDLSGRKVATLAQNARIGSGNTSLQFASPTLSKSLYFCVFESAGERMTRKILIMKK